MTSRIPYQPTTSELPTRVPGIALRIVATNDLLATFTPLPTTYGHTGSIPHIQHLLDLERQDGPTLWLDSGDLAGGALRTVLREHWPHAFTGVPIDAATAGNHEFDDHALLTGLGHTLEFPLLCADREAGLPPSTILTTPVGSVGVIGISHPASDMLGIAPARRADWAQTINDEAASLRAAGARWVVALWHNGVTWTSTSTRTSAWEAETSRVADSFDLILGGHTLNSWTGTLNGIPAGHGYGFAGSVLVVDLPTEGAAHVHAPHVLGASAGDAISGSVSGGNAALCAQLEQWQSTSVGHLPETLTMRPGESNDLGDFIARAWLNQVADADAALVPASELWTQPPVDGTVAALRAGDISELDLRRLFPYDDKLVLIELRRGQWETIVAAHNQAADFTNRDSDSLWWNWARGRAGAAQEADSPRRMVTSRFAARLMTGEDLPKHPADVRASEALEKLLQR